MISFEAAGMTDRGLLRDTNEDALCLDPENGFFVVADGMGGHNAGEVASRMVIHSLMQSVQEMGRCPKATAAVDVDGRSTTTDMLTTWIQQANRSVFRAAVQNPRLKGMGSTVAVVWIANDRLVAANVGDSAIYRFHRKDIVLLSEMHTVAVEYAHRQPHRERSVPSRYGSMLTRAIGASESIQPHVHETSVSPDDHIVLCSDGLTNLVYPSEIRDVVHSLKPSAACIRLIDLANGRGGSDNISVIVIRIKRVPWLTRMTGSI